VKFLVGRGKGNDGPSIKTGKGGGSRNGPPSKGQLKETGTSPRGDSSGPKKTRSKKAGENRGK